MASPPPLPERKSSDLPPPPPYSITAQPHDSVAFPTPGEYPESSLRLSGDPRTSSSQSLLPSVSDSDVRRTLLIVYVHGFYGNDQSFRSFPAHVHNFLRDALSDSHVVHSKIYPRYKTYKAIDVARDNFSAWLEPHEAPTTDVILVGHSMGGLLAAEVVLKPNHSPYHQYPFKHRILGTISLDSPFLGLHPGIVVSGISSLFQPAPQRPDEHLSLQNATPSSQSIDSQLQASPISPPISVGQLSRQPTDPNFDPPFVNDEPFREQPFFTRMINFASKHYSEGLFQAMGNHIAHHLEFGGCLADYHGLISRYRGIRELEDVDELKALSDGHPSGSHARVRFVNYYTLSSGRPKPPQPSSGSSHAASQMDVSTSTLEVQSQEDGKSAEEANSPISSSIQLESKEEEETGSKTGTSTPKFSIKGHDSFKNTGDRASTIESDLIQKYDTDAKAGQGSESPPDLSRLSMQEIEPLPMDDIDDAQFETGSKTSILETPEGSFKDALSEQQEQQPPSSPPTSPPPPPPEPTSSSSLDLDLPPIPELPQKPEQPDFDQYTDKASRKQAEKEFARLQKTYDQALKTHTKTLREREKLLEKRRKKAQKETEKLEKEARKENQRLEKQEKKRLEKEAAAAAAAAKQDGEKTVGVIASPPHTAADEKEKPKKLKKFCNLPGTVNGMVDPTWVDVYMDGMDEVGAHCGLFFPGPHYDKLVGDVGSRVVSWVHDDLSKRALLDLGY